MRKNQVGYLPDEKPSIWETILFAFQQIIVMFPATVLVALLTGFHVSTTIFASGLATLCFILITKRKIPLYYGSSFSYIAAIVSITGATFGQVASDALIGQAQFGIIMSGLISIGVGLLITRVKMSSIEKVLPATVTGPMAMIIGLSLAGVALTDITNAATPALQNANWVIGLITFFATVLFSIYLKKGTWGQIPILLGLVVGYIVAVVIGLIINAPIVNFGLMDGTVFSVPHFTLPIPTWTAILAIMPIAIATIPESTAHLYQLDIYVNKLAEEKKIDKKYNIADKLGINLVGDGIGDMISGMVGGPAGTNYGENISVMSITKNYSIWVLIAASVITMIMSFITPISAIVYSVPAAVIGGLAIYLFGVIAAQGVAIMIDKKVSLFDGKNLAIIATMMIIGIGGSFAFAGGMIPFFGLQMPAIATAAVAGIGLNGLFLLIDYIKAKRA